MATLGTFNVPSLINVISLKKKELVRSKSNKLERSREIEN